MRRISLPSSTSGFIFDFTHNFFQHVFNRHQARYTAVFIDYDGHVIAILPELPQQYVESFAFRHNHGGAQQAFQVELGRRGR